MTRPANTVNNRTRSRSDRGGFALVWLALVLVVLLGVTALVIDLGRLHVARTELQGAADAAARAAAWHVPGNLTRANNEAISIAAANTCTGAAVTLDPSADIRYGKWNPANQTFTPLAGSDLSSADAVQVTARRADDRDTAIPTTFAQVFGINTMNASAEAIARITQGALAAGGIVGLDWVDLSGTPMVDSYNSDLGPYNPLKPGQNAVVVSNNDILGNGHPTVAGDAVAGPGHSVSSSISVTGSKSNLDQPLVFPPANADAYRLVNDNALIRSYLNGQQDLTLKGNDKLHVPAGDYYIRDLKMTGNAVLYIDGPVTFHITGSVDVAGTVNTTAQKPANFQIQVTGSGTVDLRGNADLHSAVYAPESPIIVRGTHDFYGSIIGRSIRMVGTSDIHVDESLIRRGPSKVVLVK